MAILKIRDKNGNMINIPALQGPKGNSGTDGNTPYIKDGNWWIGDTDTGVKAEGIDGQNGKDGIDGVDGADGIGIEKSEINSDGELIITYSDGNSVNLGVIIGSDGKDGNSGVYVGSGDMPEDCNVQIDLNGETLDTSIFVKKDYVDSTIGDIQKTLSLMVGGI